jgi:hypothetical protein
MESWFQLWRGVVKIPTPDRLVYMSFLSANLAVQLTEDSLPWNRSTQIHIDAFLKLYTLHDSYWIGMHTGCAWGDAAVAVVRFDPIWNPSVSLPTSSVSNWPLLFLRFNCVSTIRLSDFRDNGGVQRGISGATMERISDEEVVTVIRDHYGASVSLQHFPLVDVLVMTANEDVVELAASPN